MFLKYISLWLLSWLTYMVAFASCTDKIFHSCAIIWPTKFSPQDSVCGYKTGAIKMDGSSDKKPKCCHRKFDFLAIFSLFLNTALIGYVVYGSVSQQKTNLIVQQTDESLKQDTGTLKQVSPANSTDMHCRYMRSVKVYVSHGRILPPTTCD